MSDAFPGRTGRAGQPGEGLSVGPADVDLNRVWTQIAAEVWRRSPGPLERLARWLLRSPGLARALVTTPSLLAGWVLASAAVLFAGAVADISTGTPWIAILAPAIAAAGIAFAYGPAIDPAFELSQSMAVSDRVVLLARALAVFGLNAVLGLAASAASGTAVALTFGWLVPMTAVCALALAAATLARSAIAGVLAGLAGWAITLLGARTAAGSLTAAVASTSLIAPYLLFAAACAVVTWQATRIPRGS